MSTDADDPTPPHGTPIVSAPMTAAEAAAILNRQGYGEIYRGKAQWYVRWDGCITDGLCHTLDPFTAIAVAEKYARERA
jgi:hypothetical protein